jgi:hypothetical protein
MKKDEINILFENLDGCFDVHKTPSGHQARFLQKLQSSEKTITKKLNWWKPVSIAASIAVIFTIGTFLMNGNTLQETDLASISPEMKETQSFFTTTINKELQTLKSFEDPASKQLVNDALLQIETLETEYEKLKIDLAKSGNDKRVIYAMISNFQSRIDILQQVITTIEEIKNLKAYRNETTL